MNNLNEYRALCQEEATLPIFSQAWWLDATVGQDQWAVALTKKGGEIVGSLPYIKKKKYIFNMLAMPPLTQTLGPYIKYPRGQKYYKKLSWEKEIMSDLILQLPVFDAFIQNFHCSVTNWLPFYWQGFSQTTRYSYRINDISLDALEESFETDIRRRRKKAEKHGVYVEISSDLESFYALNAKTFQRKKLAMPYTFEFIKNLFSACSENDAVKIFIARDEQHIPIATNFLVYDAHTVYYLMGGIEPKKRDLGGMDLILYESIKFALESGRCFDFEGSMVESIEKYFRSFGATQVPYFSVSKIPSRILKLLYAAKKN